MNENCIFCSIVAGRIPCSRVYEDKSTLAFMDIGPIVKGHVLVIPKTHFNPLMETPPDVLTCVIATVRRVARALTAALGAEGINVTQANGACAGQVVPHLHFHVIPRFSDDGHRWNWNAKTYASPAEMQALADRIASSM